MVLYINMNVHILLLFMFYFVPWNREARNNLAVCLKSEGFPFNPRRIYQIILLTKQEVVDYVTLQKYLLGE